MLVTLILSMLVGLASSVQPQLIPFRLPSDVFPQHYNLSLLTDLDHFLFSGFVKIQIMCKHSTSKIKLHSSGLNIDFGGIRLRHLRDDKIVPVIGFANESAFDFLVIKAKGTLKSGYSYLLHIPFSGGLSTSLTGYYRTSYKDTATNTTQWLAVTQFEPIEARRVFPCFDEPAMKASFAISLGHKPHLTALSNMPVQSSQKRGGWIWDTFEDSKPMSTYLVAFMVSDFKFRESQSEPNSVTFRTWSHKDVLDQVEFSSKYGPKVLNFFEELFNIPYPLPKQDLVALPEFIMGAMENWGLITFRENALLVDDCTTSMEMKRSIIGVLAHELAHQWFGNLVTMEWWTGIWLNEGFATYIGNLATQRLFPEWNNYNIEITKCFLRVLPLDGLKSTHPVLVPVNNPSMLFTIFDDISYRKGSLLLHMIHSFLGEETFCTGISAYLNKFKFKNTEQDDLWSALTMAAQGKQVLPSKSVTMKHIMDSWTLQSGYPVLTVRRNKGKVIVTQKRFYSVPYKDEIGASDCWWVPVTFSTAKEPKLNVTHWLDCKTSELAIDTGAGPDDWITLNNKATGIYRVNYDPKSWQLLIKALYSPARTQIDELNRMLIVSDAMALAGVGSLDYSVAFRVLKYARWETAYTPWLAVNSNLRVLETLLWRTDKYTDFQRLICHILFDVDKRIGDLRYIPKRLDDLLLKELISSWACKYQVGNYSREAQELFNAWMAGDNKSIPNDLRSVIYCEGVRRGGQPEWTFVWHRYLQSSVATEKSIYLQALACTQQEYLLKSYLEMSLDPSSGVTKKDTYFVFSLVASNSQLGFKLALKFLEDNIQKLHEFFQPNTHILGSYVKDIVKQMVFESEIKKVKIFLKDNRNLFVKSEFSLNQGLEQVDSNLLWMSYFYHNISQALELNELDTCT